MLAADDLVAVPDGLHATEAQTVIVNGVAALRMLAAAPVNRGDTVVVLGADGDIGSLLVQLARHAGAQVIGVAPAYQLPYVREIGAVPVDRDADVATAVLRIAPHGTAAVFDGADGPETQATRKDLSGLNGLDRLNGSSGFNGGGAVFSRLWAELERDLQTRRARLRAGLRAVFGHLAAGAITARIARAFPLTQAAEAVRYAESGAAAGQVVLLPDILLPDTD